MSLGDPVVLMPLPEDPRGALAELVDDVNRLRSRLQATQVWGHMGGGVPGWVGQAADAYTGQITALGGRVREVAAQIGPLAGVIDSVAAAYEQAVDIAIPDLWEEYRQVAAHYAGQLALVEVELASRVAGSANPTQAVLDAAAEARGLEEKRDGELEAIVGRYERLIEGLDETIGQAAGQVVGGCQAIVPADVAGRGRPAVAQHLFPAAEFPLVVAQARWEQADAQAPLIADFLRSRHHSNADLNKFLDTYGASLADPFVVTALTRYVTPRQLAGFALDLAEEDFTIEGHTQGWSRSKEEILDLLGTTFVLATGGQNLADVQTQSLFDLASSALHDRDGATPAQLTDYFLDKLRRDGAKGVDPIEHFNDQITSFDVFTQLVGHAAAGNPELALGPEFYSPADGQQSVASDLVNWSHSEYYGKNSPPYQKLFFPMKHAPLLDPLHALFLASDGPHATLQAVIDQDAAATLGQADPSVQREYDRRAALRDFLLEDSPLTDPKTKEEISTVRYLTGHRVVRLDSGPTMGFRDGGDAFGRLLAQATAPLPPPEGMNPAQAAEWEEVDKTRAHVAGEFLVGYMDGMDHAAELDPDDANSYLTKHNFGDQYQALRHWAAHIAAPHIDGIAESVSSYKHISSGAPTAPSHCPDAGFSVPVFDKFQAARFIADGGFLSDLARVPVTVDPTDPPAPLEVLQNATIAGFREDLQEAFAGEPGQQQAAVVEQAGRKWQALHEAIHRAPEVNRLNDAVENFQEDLKTRQFFGKLASAAPIPASHPAAAATVPFLKQFTSSYLAAPPSTEAISLATKAVATSGTESMRDLTLAFLNEASQQEAFVDNDGKPAPIPHELIDPATGKIVPFTQQTEDQRNAFEEFILEETALDKPLGYISDGHWFNIDRIAEANKLANGSSDGK